MPVGTDLKYAKLEDLYLDPTNPRLGRNNSGPGVSQRDVLELMRDWNLEELAVSFLDSGGFWTHEALLVTSEKLYGKKCLVVIEGNRRIATLIYLKKAYNKKKVPKKLLDISKTKAVPSKLFTKIPYILVSSRKEIEAFLGFRHVTGIKEWKPAEKAEFISNLIDDRKMTYKEVARKIGSRVDAVRRNYISYRLLLQIEDTVDIPTEHIEERFSVMYLSLRTKGVQKYLQIDIHADPTSAKKPVPKKCITNLENYALWFFGDGDKKPPLFSDSRQVDNFGRVLESKKAVDYLKRTDNPSFEVALRTAGGDEPEILNYIEKAADNIELSLTRVHLYKKSKKIRSAVERLAADANQLLHVFPDIKKKATMEEEKE